MQSYPWTYTKGAFKEVDFNTLLLTLQEKCDTYTYRMYGRNLVSKRMACAFASDTERRLYLPLPVFSWSEAPTQVTRIRNALEHQYGLRFDYVVCNLYRDGGDNCGWHSDQEHTDVMSVSLGEARRFQFRKASASKGCEWEATLHHGDLLHMHGSREGIPSCQELYKHRVPPVGGKKGKALGARINLTFRTLNP